MDTILKYCIRTDGPFTISNGQQVNEYLDMYRILLSPSYRAEILNEMQKRLCKYPQFYFIAGRETAGALLASLIAARFSVPALVIRSRDRNHGTCEKIEKPVNFDSIREAANRGVYLDYYKNVVLVDDVSSTGIGMEDSIKALRDEGLNPVLVYSLVYRGLGAHKIAEQLGVPFEYLYYYEETLSN